MLFNDLVEKASETSGELHLVRPGRTNRTAECYDCEETISAERRAAIPGVERCLVCQRALERKGLGRVKAS